MRISDWSSDVCISDLNISFADIGSQFHVERRAFVQMADDEIGVHYLDISRHCNVPCLDFAGTGSGKLQPLGTFTFHLHRDLLHVENDIGDVLTHARERGEFVRSAEHTSALQSLMRNSY